MGRILFISFIKNFFTHFRRSLNLLFKSKNKPEMLLQLSGDNSIVQMNVFQVRVELQNILFLIIHGSIYPILHDHVIIGLTIPLKKGSNEIEFIAVGLFKTKRLMIKVDSQGILSLVELYPPKQSLIKAPIISDLNYQINGLKEPRLASRKLIKLKYHARIGLYNQEVNLKYDTNDLESELYKSYKYE